MYRELMFTALEYKFTALELMFIARKHNFSRCKDTFPYNYSVFIFSCAIMIASLHKSRSCSSSTASMNLSANQTARTALVIAFSHRSEFVWQVSHIRDQWLAIALLFVLLSRYFSYLLLFICLLSLYFPIATTFSYLAFDDTRLANYYYDICLRDSNPS